MSFRKYLNTTVDIYRPVLTQQADSSWVENRPTTPTYTGIRVCIEPTPMQDQFLFGRLGNPANFLLGHKPQEYHRMVWLDDDIQEYDEILWNGPGGTGKHYVLEGLIKDDHRYSLKQQFGILKERTSSY